MKRRQALQNMAMVSAGIVFLPSCDIFEGFPEYNNVPLEKDQFRLIRGLSKSILPKQELEIKTNESTLEFVLTMVNDCSKPKEIQDFLAGLTELEQYIQDKYNKKFWKMEEAMKMEIVEHLESSEALSEELKLFYSTIKRLTIQHFTSSDYFMSNYLDYELVPSRYFGCVKV